MRLCTNAGCPELVSNRGRCPEHQRQHERTRGTRTARGYGTTHVQLRAQWAPQVATGTVQCWRCHNLIPAGTEWHLGHDDNDRNIYRGPEHATCNLSAAGHSSHKGQGRVPKAPPAQYRRGG